MPMRLMGYKPDVTLLFDVDSETGLARIAASGEREVNRLDLEKLDLHQRVRQGYLDLAQAEPERIKLIDASQAFEDVVEQAWEVIKRLFIRSKMKLAESQSKLFEEFSQIIRENRLSHAYLFSGDFGSLDMAIWLAQSRFCLTPEDGLPCGHCRSCRLIAQGDFSDVKLVEATRTDY